MESCESHERCRHREQGVFISLLQQQQSLMPRHWEGRNKSDEL